jgi:hypothetical protein
VLFVKCLGEYWRKELLWPTGITSHSIYAVVGMQYPPGALAQHNNFGLKPPTILRICKHGINAVPSYFSQHGFAHHVIPELWPPHFRGGSPLRMTGGGQALCYKWNTHPTILRYSSTTDLALSRWRYQPLAWKSL